MNINLKLFKRCPECGNKLIKKDPYMDRWNSAQDGAFLVTPFICPECGYKKNTVKDVTGFFQQIWHLSFLYKEATWTKSTS